MRQKTGEIQRALLQKQRFATPSDVVRIFVGSRRRLRLGLPVDAHSFSQQRHRPRDYERTFQRPQIRHSAVGTLHPRPYDFPVRVLGGAAVPRGHAIVPHQVPGDVPNQVRGSLRHLPQKQGRGRAELRRTPRGVRTHDAHRRAPRLRNPRTVDFRWDVLPGVLQSAERADHDSSVLQPGLR